MAVNTDLQGTSYSLPEPYEVSREAIIAFANATKAANSAHRDAAEARPQGYSDIVAPPTFAVIPAQRAEALYISKPEAGIDFSRVVHGSEQFSYTRPIVAGDSLHATCHVDGLRGAGGHTMITTRTEITDESDAPVVTVTSTIVVRGGDDD